VYSNPLPIEPLRERERTEATTNLALGGEGGCGAVCREPLDNKNKPRALACSRARFSAYEENKKHEWGRASSKMGSLYQYNADDR